MGWLRDDDELGAHEGYVTAAVRIGGGWEELRYGMPAAEHPRPVSHVQVACTCGWRSERLAAPLGTEWMRYCVLFPTTYMGASSQDLEDAAAALWSRHVDEVLAGGPLRFRFDRLEPAARLGRDDVSAVLA